MEQLVIGKYPANSFCLWDGDELIARTALFIFDSPEDMLMQLKIALIAYMRGNHLPYLYVNTGIKLLLKHVYKYKPNNNKDTDLELIKIAYKMVNNNIGLLKEIKYKSIDPIFSTYNDKTMYSETRISRNGDLMTRLVFKCSLPSKNSPSIISSPNNVILSENKTAKNNIPISRIIGKTSSGKTAMATPQELIMY
jgi:hypothetical protein